MSTASTQKKRRTITIDEDTYRLLVKARTLMMAAGMFDKTRVTWDDVLIKMAQISIALAADQITKNPMLLYKTD